MLWEIYLNLPLCLNIDNQVHIPNSWRWEMKNEKSFYIYVYLADNYSLRYNISRTLDISLNYDLKTQLTFYQSF